MKFIYTIVAALLIFASQAQSQQKRYKQRNHKLQASSNLYFNSSMDLDGALNVSYAKNWGYFEIGGLIGIMPSRLEFQEFNLKDLGLEIALTVEGNFIKNKRKNNWIPGFGLKISYMPKEDFFINPYLISKWFISYRTALNLTLEYPLQVHDGFKGWSGINILFGYSYYFH